MEKWQLRYLDSVVPPQTKIAIFPQRHWPLSGKGKYLALGVTAHPALRSHACHHLHLSPCRGDCSRGPGYGSEQSQSASATGLEVGPSEPTVLGSWLVLPPHRELTERPSFQLIPLDQTGGSPSSRRQGNNLCHPQEVALGQGNTPTLFPSREIRLCSLVHLKSFQNRHFSD